MYKEIIENQIQEQTINGNLVITAFGTELYVKKNIITDSGRTIGKFAVNSVIKDICDEHRVILLNKEIYIMDFEKEKFPDLLECCLEVKGVLKGLDLLSPTFEVSEIITGEHPVFEDIRREDWLKSLSGKDAWFCVNEKGDLVVKDDYGNCCSCPKDRFLVNIRFNGKVMRSFVY